MFRGFSASSEAPQPGRTVDNDAPRSLRNELLELAFTLAVQATLGDRYIYDLIELTIGATPSGNPSGSFRRSASRDLSRVDWVRVYDLIIRLAHEFSRVDRFEQYRTGVNRILASNGVVWDLAADATLVRVLPADGVVAITTAGTELRASQYEAARALFDQAKEAYNARPQRSRDACANAFDAMESVAKTILSMPTATFGNVIAELRRRGALTPEILEMLSKQNDTRNKHFGHGMTAPFTLKPSEVDFVYLSSVAAMILLVRGLG
jgi:hypothetical protein